MALLAASGLGAALPFLFILICPLAMVFMMRGMHGHGGHHAGGPKPRGEMTMDELKHERDELNDEIGRRAEQAAHDTESTGATI
jgi:DUF2933 family protein